MTVQLGEEKAPSTISSMSIALERSLQRGWIQILHSGAQRYYKSPWAQDKKKKEIPPEEKKTLF